MNKDEEDISENNDTIVICKKKHQVGSLRVFNKFSSGDLNVFGVCEDPSGKINVWTEEALSYFDL